MKLWQGLLIAGVGLWGINQWMQQNQGMMSDTDGPRIDPDGLRSIFYRISLILAYLLETSVPDGKKVDPMQVMEGVQRLYMPSMQMSERFGFKTPVSFLLVWGMNLNIASLSLLNGQQYPFGAWVSPGAQRILTHPAPEPTRVIQLVRFLLVGAQPGSFEHKLLELVQDLTETDPYFQHPLQVGDQHIPVRLSGRMVQRWVETGSLYGPNDPRGAMNGHGQPYESGPPMAPPTQIPDEYMADLYRSGAIGGQPIPGQQAPPQYNPQQQHRNAPYGSHYDPTAQGQPYSPGQPPQQGPQPQPTHASPQNQPVNGSGQQGQQPISSNIPIGMGIPTGAAQ